AAGEEVSDQAGVRLDEGPGADGELVQVPEGEDREAVGGGRGPDVPDGAGAAGARRGVRARGGAPPAPANRGPGVCHAGWGESCRRRVLRAQGGVEVDLVHEDPDVRLLRDPREVPQRGLLRQDARGVVRAREDDETGLRLQGGGDPDRVESVAVLETPLEEG